ncbi:hypothetical protein K457DRAFT_22359 [Linnemannia elongata AG-77]|uniref:Uncharacterized protein n=1 Tax=Linnemannia elongata AG-77 TaxID=1314771 RepID=A0A197JMM7_9FUNG|nr:hypothetical protein K457DRAFT_22359 [Linnemannia elongata AG-77]
MLPKLMLLACSLAIFGSSAMADTTVALSITKEDCLALGGSAIEGQSRGTTTRTTVYTNAASTTTFTRTCSECSIFTATFSESIAYPDNFAEFTVCTGTYPASSTGTYPGTCTRTYPASSTGTYPASSTGTYPGTCTRT